MLLAATLLSGCVSKLLTAPPPATYDLAGVESAPSVKRRTSAQVLVPEPFALQTLASQRIVVTRGPLVAYYPNAQYPDTLPRLVQSRVIQAFEKSKGVRAIGRPGEGLSIDYQLLTNIRTFAFDVTPSGRFAEIEIFTQIMNDRTGKVVEAKLFKASVPVAEDTAPAAVTGLNAALDQVLVEMVAWAVPRL
ncbi:ABC-type transport auxiliary lipoprotein family protein [Kaistia defluvii]|uniref:Cholesterol transport system auxiliary component n=1 Tax=Kaistia defluvii TaxID=410841 RepID=A0ABV2QW74_9HYPH